MTATHLIDLEREVIYENICAMLSFAGLLILITVITQRYVGIQKTKCRR